MAKRMFRPDILRRGLRIQFVVAALTVLLLNQRTWAQPTADEERYLYFWVPRTTDVGRAPDDPDRQRLVYLLSHTPTVTYTVSKDDITGIDGIMRQQFFVSSTPFPEAFSLYKAELFRRNPGLDATATLYPEKTILNLPAAPKFAALTFPDLDIRSYYAAAASTFSQHAISAQRIRATLAQSLSPYTKYARSVVAGGQQALDAALTEIVERRIIPANSPSWQARDVIIAAEPVIFSTKPNESVPLLVQPRTSQEFLPAAAPPAYPIDCSGQCSSCATILGVKAPLAVGRVRLLIADTGIANPTGVVTQYSATKGNFKDVDPDFHGSFVYSEVVGTLKGILPESSVHVAKVALPVPAAQSPSGRPYQWSMAALKKAIDNFAMSYLDANPLDAGNPQPGPVWIVNVSAGGKPVFGQDVPTLLNSDRILLVASAGNDHSYLSPSSDLFPKIDNITGNILIVGALDKDNRSLAPYSNFHNSQVDLFVQGSCVCGSPKQLNGTSQAAPIASAAAVMVAAKYPQWNARQVKLRLISSSDVTPETSQCAFAGFAGRCGVGGILNLPRALANATFITYKRVQGQQTITQADIPVPNLAQTAGEGWVSFLGLRPDDDGVLRIHREHCDNAGDRCTFTVFRIGFYPQSQDTTLKSITIDVNGTLETISTKLIDDIYLPMK